MLYLPMIVVLADDLSGAAEIAGIAASRGLIAEVQTGFEPNTDADLIAVDADTRLLPEADAVARIQKLGQHLAATNPDRVYKKVDSVLRGHVAAESLALLDALHRKRAVVLSANPSRGRVIREGRYFINDVPLDLTSFADDPDYPAKTSRVADLLGNHPELHTPNAQTLADMQAAAASVQPEDLPVGGADFFTALLERWPPEKAPANVGPWLTPSAQSLFICGSLASWNDRQAKANSLGLPVEIIGPNAPSSGSSPNAVAGSHMIGLGPRIPSASSSKITRTLATAAAGQIRTGNVSQVFCEGGATAAALMKVMSWTRFRVIPGAPAGIGALEPVDTTGLRLFIKPGSYPWPEEVWPALEG